MSFFLPLLLAGALVSSTAANNSDDKSIAKSPRKSRVVIVDTAAHRQLAADLVVRARAAAEGGLLEAARAPLLVANTMLRESGGPEEAPANALVHVDYALKRYNKAGALLNALGIAGTDRAIFRKRLG